MSTASVSGVFAALGDLVKQDLLQAAAAPLISFLQAVQKNPAPINVALQFGLLQAALISSLPNLELNVIQQLAASLQKHLEDAVAAETPAAAPAA